MGDDQNQFAMNSDQNGSYTLDQQLVTDPMSFVADAAASPATTSALNVTQSAVTQGSTGTYDQYFQAFAVRETRGGFDFTQTPNYQQGSGNSYPALGAYQFDKASLIAIGYYTNDGALSDSHWNDASFTGKNGITSEQSFLNNPAVQDQAAREWSASVGWPAVVADGLPQYIGQTIAGINITAAGLLAGTSLLGPDAVKQFITSGGQNDPTEAYGTHVSEYISNFAGFQTPFDNAPATGPVLATNL